MEENLLKYFNNDELAANVWKSKYAAEGEETPDDMHRRMAKEFAKIEQHYLKNEQSSSKKENLSKYGKERKTLNEEKIYELFKDFKYIIPQGSIMATLGTNQIASLSNCWVIESPLDSYAGIHKADGDLIYYYKRRGGVGVDISNLRPANTKTNNAAKTSTGAVSFMHRFSNTTREVAMNGRRGALMISIDINHPDVMDFIKVKRDGTSVTGANISIRLNKEFMKAVENDEDYVLRFPCNLDQSLINRYSIENYEYNKLEKINKGYIKRIKAREYWDEIVKSARDYAEPGLMYWDNALEYDPAGVYEQYKPISTNPCFHPDTLIETEYGRIKIKDIDKPMRVYSMDSDGRLIMSNATKSFISKKNAETLKITLRNGNFIQVTPEHKMYVHNKGWVEAKDLKIGDKIGHLCRSRRGAKYSGVHLTTSPNGQKDQVMEHKFVYGVSEAGFDIHHLDRNTYNNSIDNLELLTHSEHSRITATEDNPQTHQVRDNKGKFVSGTNSRKGKKIIIDLPEELKTNILSPQHNAVISIEKGETTDVYDIQVEGTHCLIANNMVAHNCGEQFLQANDSCRLMVHNLFNYVDEPFTENAKFNEELFYKNAYECMRLGDDLVDLEAEYIQRIIDKINSDPEPDDIKRQELELWVKSKRICQEGRRVGIGITALGDTLAALNVKYDSEEGLDIIANIMKIKMEAELDCSIDLAILRGAFDGYNSRLEFSFRMNNYGKASYGKNKFYQMLLDEFPEKVERMCKYGRRSISWSTIAPTGSVSLLADNCTSGCEPLFQPFYMRRKKINPGEAGVRVDFVDEVGDSWQEFPVLHPKFKEWIEINYIDVIDNQPTDVTKISKERLQELFEESPWYGSTANDIDWRKRVEIQAILQKYTTNAISSTINLPSTVTYEEVSDIYMYGWEKGLKGQTVYVDGSRSGVLITENKNKSREEFNYVDAVKRPKELPCKVHVTSANGVKYNVFVGLMNGKAYEVFVTNYFTNEDNLTLKKIKKGRYDLLKNGKTYSEDITTEMSDEQEAITRLVSTSLRHGADIKFIVEQLNKTSEGNMFGFTRGLARVLKKYIPDGAKSTMSCSDCGSNDVIFEEGCNKCRSCGSSKCG